MAREFGRVITQENLRELLDYKPSTGIFTWKSRPLELFRSKRSRNIWNTRYSSKIAGGIKSNGYRYISINKKRYLAHRLAWLYMYGCLPMYQIDHVNGSRHDNRIDNLREATPLENNQNIRVCQKGNVTGILGVHFHKQSGMYRSRIQFNGKQSYLGLFKTMKDAHKAYVEAKSFLHAFSTLK